MSDIDKKALEKAWRNLNDIDPAVRAIAARKLGELLTDDPEALSHLRYMAESDPAEEARSAAKESLIILGQLKVPGKVPPSASRSLKPAESAMGDTGIIDSEVLECTPAERKIIELLQRQNQMLDVIQYRTLKTEDKVSESNYNVRTSLVGLDLSISSLVVLMLKWFVAAIPVGILVGAFYLLISIIF